MGGGVGVNGDCLGTTDDRLLLPWAVVRDIVARRGLDGSNATRAAGAAVGGVFRPQEYGAKGDGRHNDTAAVRAAAAACGAAAAKGDGCALTFAGGSFLTGPFALPSHSVVTVAAGATLLAAPMAQWNAAGWRASALMTGEGLTSHGRHYHSGRK
jgi:polygalacturonase